MYFCIIFFTIIKRFIKHDFAQELEPLEKRSFFMFYCLLIFGQFDFSFKKNTKWNTGPKEGPLRYKTHAPEVKNPYFPVIITFIWPRSLVWEPIVSSSHALDIWVSFSRSTKEYKVCDSRLSPKSGKVYIVNKQNTKYTKCINR